MVRKSLQTEFVKIWKFESFAIERLPDGEDIKKLKGYDDLFRLRVGNYRIVYTVDNGKLIVYVIDVDNRGEIYKRY